MRHRESQHRPMTRVGCALLGLWIFILSLAGTSPALHAWLHADSSCAHQCSTAPADTPDHSETEGHTCGVIALQGADARAPMVLLPERKGHQHIEFRALDAALPTQEVHFYRQARAPPIEILV